jgi:hypothetical protein
VQAYLVVPAVTILAAGFAMVTLATPRVLVAVRVWGGPTAAGTQSVRLQCVRRAIGIDDSVAVDGLEVDIAGQRSSARCGEDGQAEVTVTLPSEGRARVRVVRAGVVLAEGDARVTRSEWLRDAVEFPTQVAGGGTLAVRASVEGGVVVMGRPTRIRLRVAEELRAPGALRVSCGGCEVSEPRPAEGGLDVVVTPTFVTASLSLEQARAEGAAARGAWEARLPVASGALSVDSLRNHSARIAGVVRAPQVRSRAYVRVQDGLGRRAAAALALSPDGRGGSFAPFELPLGALDEPAWLVVSPEPSLGSPSALSWPLPPPSASAHRGAGPDQPPADGRVVPDKLWLDGLEPMYARERARVDGMLGSVGAVIAMGALLESLLLYERSRASRRRLAQHLARYAADEGPAGPGGAGGDSSGNHDALSAELLEERGAGFRIALAIVAVLFGFAVVAVVLMGRISL